MGAASYAIFLHAPLVLLGAAWLYRKSLKRALPCLVIALGLALVATDAFLYEPHALVTSTYEIKSRESVRVVVMSDFQADHIGDYERSVLLRIAELRPELLLLAGDYIQVYGEPRAGVVHDFRQAWEAANIHPKLGVFAVRGDVEPDGWEDELFGGLGVVTSDQTKTLAVGDLTLTLLSLRDSRNRHLALPHSSAPSNIVLGHRPDFALGTGPAGLLVAGHTHGGQVQLPFFGPPFILSAVPHQWGGGGLHVVDASRSLLVTRGAGVEHVDDAPAVALQLSAGNRGAQHDRVAAALKVPRAVAPSDAVHSTHDPTRANDYPFGDFDLAHARRGVRQLGLSSIFVGLRRQHRKHRIVGCG